MMRVTSYVVLGAALLALTPAAGSAQDRRIHVNVGGGPTFQGGDLGSRFSTGWGPAVGVTVDGPNRQLAFQFEYAYRYFSLDKDYILPVGTSALDANHSLQQLDFNAIYNITKHDSPFRIYVMAGPGAYYKKVEITNYVGNGVICDPWLYVCGVYPVSSVIGSRSEWDIGFNAGGGVGFKLGEEGEFYIESRFHYVAGTQYQSTLIASTGTGVSSRGYYYPLTFGFRF
jgi:hypothetical protein